MRDDLVTKADLAAAVSGLENRMLKVAVGLSLAVVTGQTALTAGLLKLLQQAPGGAKDSRLLHTLPGGNYARGAQKRIDRPARAP